MPIRKNKIWRLCIKCSRCFEPSGKFSKVCDNCKPKNKWLIELEELQKQIERRKNTMAKKGYSAEYEAKKKLIDKYGFHNVFKNAISNQGPDYLVLSKGRIKKVVEVKECHKKKYYPSKREEEQFRRIRLFCKEHSINAELWIKYPNHGWDIKLL